MILLLCLDCMSELILLSLCRLSKSPPPTFSPQKIILQRLIMISRLPHDLADRTDLGGQPAITLELQRLRD